MKAYTIANATKSEGIEIARMEIKSANIVIPCIEVGESGRGRNLARIPVKLLPAQKQAFDNGQNVSIRYAKTGTTVKGNPQIIETEHDETPDSVLIAFRSHYGFRGGCNHTGDRKDQNSTDAGFLPWPGTDLIAGHIAQGDASGMGGNSQPLTIMPIDQVFRVAPTGRRCDDPHYGIYTGNEVLYMDWESRTASELF